MHYFYVLQSMRRPDQIYTGSTDNLKIRITQHNRGEVFSTKRYNPWKLVYCEAFLSEKDARIREQKFKKHGKGNDELKKRLKHSLNMNKFKKGEGFTLIELIVVFAIIAIIMSFGLPFGLDNYRNFILTSEVRTLVSLLRRAESLALANIYEKSHGVAIQDDKFVVFQGTTFAMRDLSYDEIYWRSKSINIAGPFLEFVFAPISSLTNNSSTITLTSGTKSQTIGVNGYGAINW